MHRFVIDIKPCYEVKLHASVLFVDILLCWSDRIGYSLILLSTDAEKAKCVDVTSSGNSKRKRKKENVV